MSYRQCLSVRLAISCLFLGLLCPEMSQGTAAEPQSPPPAPIPVERLLPARTVLLWQDEGSLAHGQAYSQTAASEALSATGVYEALGKLFTSLFDQETDADSRRALDVYLSLIRQGMEHGFSLALGFPDQQDATSPSLILVLHRGGTLTQSIADICMENGSSAGSDSQFPPPPPVPEDVDGESHSGREAKTEWIEQQLETRKVWTTSNPGLLPWSADWQGISFWNEGGHLIVAIGPQATERTIAIADGKQPNVSSHRLWPSLHQQNAGFSRRAFGWVDIGLLRQMVEKLVVEDVAESLAGVVGVTPPVVTSNTIESAPRPEVMPVFNTQNTYAIPAPIPESAAYGVSPDLAGNSVLTPIEDAPDHARSVAKLPAAQPKPAAKPRAADSPAIPLVIDDESANAMPVVMRTEISEDEALTVDVADETHLVSDLMTRLGLDGLDAWTWQSGYRGRAQWSESSWRTIGERRGLLKLATDRTMSIDDLPPLPANISSFTAMTVELATLLRTVRALYRDLAELNGPEGSDEADKFLAEISSHLDLQSIKELMAGLDTVVCSYNDNSNGPLTFGPVLVWKVKDATRIRDTLNRLADAAQAAVQASADVRPADAATDPVPVLTVGADVDQSTLKSLPVTRTRRYGHELLTIAHSVTIAVHDHWLVCSLNPQLVEAFLLRADGKLPRWQLTDAHKAGLRELPTRFTSVTIDDPQRSLPFWFSLAPTGLNVLDQLVEQTSKLTTKLPVNPKQFQLADFPPAELIVQPLFPNITVTLADDQGVHSFSRTSLRSVSWWNALSVLIVAGSATDLIDGIVELLPISI